MADKLETALKLLDLKSLGIEAPRDLEICDDMVKVIWTHPHKNGTGAGMYMIGQIGIGDDNEIRAYSFKIEPSLAHPINIECDEEFGWAYKIAASFNYKKDDPTAVIAAAAKVHECFKKAIAVIEKGEAVLDETREKLKKIAEEG
jgi:hypothetical protein